MLARVKSTRFYVKLQIVLQKKFYDIDTNVIELFMAIIFKCLY
jgi:hypothetical protein